MLRQTQPIVSATRTLTVCTRSTSTLPILARPAVLARSISTGIYKSKSKTSASAQQICTRKMSSSNYNQGEVSTFGFQERQPSEGEKQLVEDVLKLCAYHLYLDGPWECMDLRSVYQRPWDKATVWRRLVHS